MNAASTCLAIVWGIWVIAWMLAAAWTAKTVVHQSAASRLGHAVPLAVGAALLFFRTGRLGPLSHSLFPLAPWMAWTGVGAALAGLGLAGWARVQLGRFWSGTVTLKADHALIRTGPYGITRHPIYTGLLLALAGTALVRDSVGGLLGLAFLVAAIATKVRQEERLLIAHFGPAYEAYAAEVPALIPRLR